MLAYDCGSDQARLWQGDDGGANRDRTAGLLRARQALSQLSYGPTDTRSVWAILFRPRHFVATHSLLCESQNNAGLDKIWSAWADLNKPRNLTLLFTELPGVRSHQLSCPAIQRMVGLGRFELPTSPSSAVRSIQLSSRPEGHAGPIPKQSFALVDQVIHCEHLSRVGDVVDKEVIQPQVPLRLPCYDFTPVMNHTVVIALRS